MFEKAAQKAAFFNLKLHKLFNPSVARHVPYEATGFALLYCLNPLAKLHGLAFNAGIALYLIGS
jgi:hypothetical protein